MCIGKEVAVISDSIGLSFYSLTIYSQSPRTIEMFASREAILDYFFT